jgi:hypothetical protein
VALFMLGGAGDVELYEEDNVAVDRLGNALPKRGRYTTSKARIIDAPKPTLPASVKQLAAPDVENSVIANAGARPWDRDAIDARIVADTVEGRGAIIDSEEEVGGYPRHPETRQPFDEKQWDLATMTPRTPPVKGNIPR